MALVAVDTDVLIDHLKGIESAVEHVRELAQSNRLRTTTINIFELLSGAENSKRGEMVKSLVGMLEAFPLDRRSAAAAAQIRGELQAAGQAIGMGDSLIVGICVAHDVPLMTGNHKHFSRVQGLEVIRVNR